MAREPGASRDTAAPHVTPHVPRGAYPELKAGRKESDVHDNGLALSKMIMNKTTTGGSMFAPV